MKDQNYYISLLESKGFDFSKNDNTKTILKWIINLAQEDAYREGYNEAITFSEGYDEI